ncbi:MAG: exonuclease SbcCD subunit D [Fusobacteriaceae bacterium]|nr:exonuclease SbcCD subunit D [Fusobacteriaceae bacterium]
MKILHCADIHLGKRPFGTKEFLKKRYEDFFLAFSKVVDIAVDRKIDIVVIAGDFFDKREITPDILEKSENLLKKLSDKSIKVLIIEGNHDNINADDEINSWQNYLGKKNYVQKGSYKIIDGQYIFDCIKIGDVNFYMAGYPSFAVDTVLESLGEQLNPNEKNYIIIHTALDGDGKEFLPGLVKKETLDKLKEKVIYIAGGHFHNHSTYPADNPYFFVPGSLEYWDVKRDRGRKKGVIILDSDTLDREFVEINPRMRMDITFTCDKNTEEEYLEEFEAFSKGLNLTGEELVIANVIVKGNKYINTISLEEILERNGALKAYINLKFEKQNSNKNENEDNVYSIKNLETEIINDWEQFRNKEKLSEYLQEFKEFQEDKGDRERDFIDLFDKMLEEEIDSYENK